MQVHFQMIYAGFDFVIRGEGELTFYELIMKFGMKELYEIDGISFGDKKYNREVKIIRFKKGGKNDYS